MKFIDKSLSIAKELLPFSNEKFRHIAFLFERNRLLAIGQNNSGETSGKADYFGRRYGVKGLIDFPMLHAEISAISRIWSKIHIDGRIKLVSVRLGRNGEMRNAKPCNKCQVILDALGIDKIWYSTENGFNK